MGESYSDVTLLFCGVFMTHLFFLKASQAMQDIQRDKYHDFLTDIYKQTTVHNNVII